MKKILALFLLMTAALCAQPAVLNLGRQGKLTVYLPEGWKVGTTDMAGTASLTITPEGNAKATCTISVTRPETDRFDTKARLKTRVEADGYSLAQQSVEGRAVAKEFALSIPGYGFYCNFTDPSLRGREAPPGQYKVITIGKIRPSPEVLIDVQILADSFRDDAYNQLLGAIEGMEFTPGR